VPPAKLRFALAAVFATTVASVAAAGQADVPAGRFHYGAFWFTPSITFSNIGLDSNVFNESEAPKSDFTASMQPSLDTAVTVAGARVAWSTRGDISYFKRYSDQGTAGGTHRLQLDVPINRVRLFLRHGYVNAKERPTPEIDVRVRRREHSASAGADVVLTALTRMSLTADTSVATFDQSAGPTAAAIAKALDRQTDRATATLTHALTPLTTLTAAYTVQRERFLGDALRNNTNGRAGVGLSFKPLALLSGHIEAGLLEFNSQDRRVPGLRAPAYSADLGYVFMGRTHFGARADRAVSYSIDDASAYYLQSSVNGTVRHALTDTFHLSVSVGRQSLFHQVTLSVPATSSAPTPATGDAVPPLTLIDIYDAGLGYDLSSAGQWALHASYITRRPIGGEQVTQFENLRLFLSVSYGLGR
jgi:hypothetical protein